MPQVPARRETSAVDYSFGQWIRKRRKALDLTQQQLARRVGCSVSAIFKIEASERRPSRQIAELLAQHLEIPTEQRALFLKVARQEKGVEQLNDPIASLSQPVSDSVSRHSPAHPLPLPLTSLIGREHELTAILQQIQNPACRLLTLTGPGGVGKTRLALEVAHQLGEAFPAEVCFVSLVGTSSAEFIVPAIADALGFVFSGTHELKSQLFSYLREKEILLVLDNLEHLLNGIELLDELLTFAPSVKLLATSREQLNLRSEWVFEVQGLPVPTHVEFERLESNSAAALFIQRAKQAKMDFTLTANDLPSIKRICQLVEGLPLGLELAATWVRMMPIKEIAREIESSVGFLTSNVRDMPPRHRSISAVFDHSWDLLSEEERHVLQRLSVFQGGFTRKAAEQVAGATLSLLSALVDKSLIRRHETHRYDLHELLRQYAEVRLQSEPTDVRDTRARHTDFYLTMLQAHKTILQSRRQREALSELSTETDNIRSAWNEAISNRRLDLVQRASWPLWYIYELRTYFQEGEALIRRGVAMVREWLAESSPNSSRAESAKATGMLGALLAHQAFFCFRLGRNRESQELFQESINLLRPLDEPAMLAYALAHYGILRALQGEFADSALNIRESLIVGESVDDRWQVALSTTFLGMAVADEGDYAEAYRLFSTSLQICRSLGDPRLISLAAGYLGQTAHTLGRVTEVPDLLREELQAAAETNDRFGIALAGVRMALVAQSRGNDVGARRMLIESIQHFREAGDTWFLSHALNLEGKIALAAGEYTQAQESFKESGKVAFATQAFPMLLDALAGLAVLEIHEGHQVRALEWLIYILGHPSSTKETKDRAEKLRAELESQLQPQQIAEVRSRAETIILEGIVQNLAMS